MVFKARPVAKVFGAVVFYLVFAHIVVQTIRFATGNERLFLALIFMLLSLDEGMELHERLIGPMRSIFVADGFLYYA